MAETQGYEPSDAEKTLAQDHLDQDSIRVQAMGEGSEGREAWRKEVKADIETITDIGKLSYRSLPASAEAEARGEYTTRIKGEIKGHQVTLRIDGGLPSGNGTVSVTSIVIAGFVPHDTCGDILSARSVKILSKCAPESLFRCSCQ